MNDPAHAGSWPPNRSMPPGDVIPEVPYPDVIAAAEWLCRAFGFRERLRIGTHRVQLEVGAGSVVVTDGMSASDPVASSHRVMIRVHDADAHAARATEAGARIVMRPADQPFGERQYIAEDLVGHHWVFSQSIADVDPRTWGGDVRT